MRRPTAINRNVYIADAAYNGTIGNDPGSGGIKAAYPDFSAARSEKGAFHCSTRPVLRTADRSGDVPVQQGSRTQPAHTMTGAL